MTDHPLAWAAAGIAQRDANQVLELGAPDPGAGWFRLDALGTPGAIETELAWIAGRTRDGVRPRDVTASELASGLGSCVAIPTAMLLVFEGVVPEVSGENLWIRRSEGGRYYDRIAFERPSYRCVTGSAGDGHRDAEPIPDRAALVGSFAGAVVATLDPLFTAIRTVAPYGVRGMWGSLADDLLTSMLWTTRRFDGTDDAQRAVAATTGEIIDAIAARQPLLKVRPTVVDLTWARGHTLFCRRGTCCMIYKAPGAGEGPERYCASCPLIDDDDRNDRWRTWLASHVPG